MYVYQINKNSIAYHRIVKKEIVASMSFPIIMRLNSIEEYKDHINKLFKIEGFVVQDLGFKSNIKEVIFPILIKNLRDIEVLLIDEDTSVSFGE